MPYTAEETTTNISCMNCFQETVPEAITTSMPAVVSKYMLDSEYTVCFFTIKMLLCLPPNSFLL